MTPLSRSTAWRGPILAAVLALGGMALSWVSTRNFTALPPDTVHTMSVARNLVEGAGYTVDFVYYHLGLPDSVRHVTELHGLLRPFVLASLYSVFSVEASTARIPGLLYLALTGLLVFWVARRLFGDAAGLLALLLTVTNVSFVLLALTGVDDVGFAFFLLCTVALLTRALECEQTKLFWWAGVAAGLAVLAKPLGFFLPVLFAVVLLPGQRRSLRELSRRFVCLLLPFSIGVAAYVVRNLVAYGSPEFRFGALEWVLKAEGLEGALRLFSTAPALSEVVAQIGFSGVVALIFQQFQLFSDAFIRVQPLWLSGQDQLAAANTWILPACLPAFGALACLALWSRQRVWVAAVALCSLGALAFVCGLYHFEVRSFIFFVPLSAISIAGLAAGPFLEAGVQRWRDVLRWLGMAVVGALCLLSCISFLDVQWTMSGQRLDSRPCGDSLYWIERATQPDDRILTFIPWHVSWFTRRESVMIPSGGVAPIETVARHYETRWMLVHAMGGRPETSRVVERFAELHRGIEVELAYRGRQCRVLRLDWPKGG